jgi:hypothetical protein
MLRRRSAQEGGVPLRRHSERRSPNARARTGCRSNGSAIRRLCAIPAPARALAPWSSRGEARLASLAPLTADPGKRVSRDVGHCAVFGASMTLQGAWAILDGGVTRAHWVSAVGHLQGAA